MDKRVAGAMGGRKSNPKKGFGSLTPAQRKEISRKAAMKRWSKKSGES